jgi:hypothetical protein
MLVSKKKYRLCIHTYIRRVNRHEYWTEQNFEVISTKFQVDGIRTNENKKQNWIFKL